MAPLGATRRQEEEEEEEQEIPVKTFCVIFGAFSCFLAPGPL